MIRRCALEIYGWVNASWLTPLGRTAPYSYLPAYAYATVNVSLYLNHLQVLRDIDTLKLCAAPILAGLWGAKAPHCN
jgi:hypothetical protein